MENDSRVGQLISNATDFLSEQVWFQQLKSKWEELDPQSRLYLQFAAIGSSAVLFMIFVFSFVWSVRSLKTELADKSDLLNMLQSANEEMRRLKDQNQNLGRAAAPGTSGPWNAYMESAATTAGIDKASLTVSAEKPVDAGKPKDKNVTADAPKESQFELGLKKVNIKQVVRFAYQLENGGRPVKLKNMTIDTKNDPTGWLDATLVVSTFTMPAAK